MDIFVDTTSPVSPARQIVETVLDAIARGELRAGDPLPSVRRMAGMALVNPNTVGKAYRDLEFLGVAAGKVGRGVFVLPDGLRKARAKRRQETRQALQKAVQAALRAGHDPDKLMRDVETQLKKAAGQLQGDFRD